MTLPGEGGGGGGNLFLHNLSTVCWRIDVSFENEPFYLEDHMDLLYFRCSRSSCVRHVANLRVLAFVHTVVPCVVVREITCAYRILLNIRPELTVNTVIYVFGCRVMTSGVNPTVTDSVSMTRRWRSNLRWKPLGSLLDDFYLNQYLIECLKSPKPTNAAQFSVFIFCDYLTNVFSFQFATIIFF